MDDPYKEIRELIAEWDSQHSAIDQVHSSRFQPFVWAELRDMVFTHEWLVERFWPLGAHLHMFAAPKTGKSILSLWIAGNIAIGRDPFTWVPIQRRKVAIIDNEMTPKDVQERTMDMGFDYDELEGWLFYFNYPVIAPMDTEVGGIETLSLMESFDCDVLIIDTLSRVVRGEENSNDTYRNFYNHTGRLLKSHDKSIARLDHSGHDSKKSRGASAKADDVDLVYSLERRGTDKESPGFKLTRTHARVSGVMEVIELALNDDPVSIKATHVRTWSEQAIRKAKELDSINAPIDASQRDTITMLKAAGFGPGKLVFLAEAMNLRKYRDPINGFLFKG